MSAFSQKAAIEMAQRCKGPLLTLDTSGPVAGVALTTPNACYVQSPQSRALPSESLAQTLSDLFSRAGVEVSQLKAIVVGLGPGSYTGLRVGLATAKGLALGGGVPLLGCSSLALVAAAQRPGWVIVLRDALRETVYLGVFRVDEGGVPTALQDDALVPQSELVARLGSLEALRGQKLLLVGDCAQRMGPDTIGGAYPIEAVKDESTCALVGPHLVESRLLAQNFDPLEELVPRYLRPSLGA